MDTKHTQSGNAIVLENGRTLANGITVAAGALATLIRLIPHPLNFSPVGAMGLFSGGRLRSWVAFAVPLGIMVFSDLVLWLSVGFDPLYSPWHISRLYVYPCFMIYVLLGRVLIRDRSFRWIGIASVVGSLQFYFLTNFFTWLTQPLEPLPVLPEQFRYSRDLSGLLHCLVAGIPFYQGDVHFDFYHGLILGDARYSIFGFLLGDLCFSVMLFGLNAGLLRLLAPLPASEIQPVPEDGILQTSASRTET
jgi:hypothetical protein